MLEVTAALKKLELRPGEFEASFGPNGNLDLTLTSNDKALNKEIADFMRHLNVAPGDKVKLMIYISQVHDEPAPTPEGVKP